MKEKIEGLIYSTDAEKTKLTKKWESHPGNKEAFDFFPPKDINRHDRKKQAEWAAMAANMTTVHNRVRIFEDVCLYSKAAMIERRKLLPEPDIDYSSSTYWLIKERTWEVLPMDAQDIAGFFHWNIDYWESLKQ